MRSVLQIAALAFVTVAMALALAHVFELPGKKRLTRELYFAVQRIYYPGFTIAGISEPAGLVTLLMLVFLTPVRSGEFGLTLLALGGVVGMQLVFWIFVQPVNKVWVQDEALGSVGAGFFAMGRSIETSRAMPEWTNLRDRWERAHVVRAGFAVVSFIALVMVLSS